MRDPIDTEKVVNHIDYTKHWLDKASQDFAEKKFASGGAILNLARAELTAAWEEAMQLKTKIVTSLPSRKRNVNWKAASSVSLLASGFIIAVVMIQFTSNPVPKMDREVSGARPAVTEMAPAAPAAVKESVEPRAVVQMPVAPVQIRTMAAHRPPARPVAAAPAPVEKSPVVAPPVVAQPPVETHEAVPAPAAELQHSEVIDLYRTAEKALNE